MEWNELEEAFFRAGERMSERAIPDDTTSWWRRVLDPAPWPPLVTESSEDDDYYAHYELAHDESAPYVLAA